MYRTAVMGDKDSIYGFAALGLDIYPESDAAHAADTLRESSRQHYAVIYITEALASEFRGDRQVQEAGAFPPSTFPASSKHRTGFKRMSAEPWKKAVGSDILNQK